MAKRPLHLEGLEGDSRKGKRLKTDIGSRAKDEQPIASAGHLKTLLTFHQDNVTQYRLNLQKFRQYLEGLSLTGNTASIEDGILLEYLTKSITNTATDQSEIIPDIFQAWRYAVQVYDEGLVPTIPGTLAALLRAISSSLEFVDVGTQICRALMRRENAQLFQKSINSARTRDTTIARCLDLLTEVVGFDGGSCAKAVWLQRGITMSRLPHLIAMSKKTIYGATHTTSVRDHAIPFFLANLRYQDQEAKAEILSNRKSVQNLLREILSEPMSIIASVLSVIKQYVVEDEKLGRSAKGHLLTDHNLGYVLAVMRNGEQDDDWTVLRDLAADVLMQSCTSRIHGILYKQNGWYPPGTEDITLNEDIQFFGGLVNSNEAIRYSERVPVRNTTLAAFIQDLKPWASPLERKLILGIFESAPELIADYFARKRAFSFDPKLTITWIGWAGFIHSVIRLPPLSYEKFLDGRVRQPPTVSIIMQSILPQPLTSQALNRAIKQPSEIIKLFTLRILVVAFEQLRIVLESFQAASSPSAWHAAAVSLLQEFQLRCPDYSQILNLYQSTSEDKHILREVMSSLLALYHTVTPQFIHDNRFDISTHITKTLNRVVADSDQSTPSTVVELQNLLIIGNCVVDAKWWQKAENSKMSTLTTILKLLTAVKLHDNNTLKTLVRGVLEETFILDPSSGEDSFEALLESLLNLKETSYGDTVYAYLDDCLLRMVRKPIKYHGDLRALKALIKEPQTGSNVTPIFMVISEQWPFFQKSHSIPEKKACAEWICSYLVCAAKVGQSVPQLSMTYERLVQDSQEKEIKRIFKNCKSAILGSKQVKSTDRDMTMDDVDKAVSHAQETPLENDIATFDARLSAPQETMDYPILSRWQGKPVQELILDGHMSNLINCLASGYQEIRLQATAALKLLMNSFQNSKYEERQSFHLLLGTMQETISQHGPHDQLPSMAVSFAASSVKILSNPLHPMYTKINHFLSRSPSWNLAKLPSYWMDRIFSKPPTQIDAHWKEVDWLLDVLLHGLRNEKDTNLYRRTGVFERLLVNCTTANAPRAIYGKTTDILYRCVLVGGATTLITRFGILAWIASQKLTNPKSDELLSTLEAKIRATCDAERVTEWSHGSIRCGKAGHLLEENAADQDDYEKLQSFWDPAEEASPAEKLITIGIIPKDSQRDLPYRYHVNGDSNIGEDTDAEAHTTDTSVYSE